jgi:hypothetical protein
MWLVPLKKLGPIQNVSTRDFDKGKRVEWEIGRSAFKARLYEGWSLWGSARRGETMLGTGKRRIDSFPKVEGIVCVYPPKEGSREKLSIGKKKSGDVLGECVKERGKHISSLSKAGRESSRINLCGLVFRSMSDMRARYHTFYAEYEPVSAFHSPQ